jgi:flavin-dependent dehydrogenase
VSSASSAVCFSDSFQRSRLGVSKLFVEQASCLQKDFFKNLLTIKEIVMYTTQSLKYDVVILGTTLAGLSQARHLMLNIPNVKIALVDIPAQALENEPPINDSTIEIADLFFCKELGLHDYLIENHILRSTLSFHWPKSPDKTTNLDDYYHIWCNRQLSIASYQINRSKFEQDLLLMNEAMGATVYTGSVVDVELTKGNNVNTVKIQVADQEITLTADHIIDSWGHSIFVD